MEQDKAWADIPTEGEIQVTDVKEGDLASSPAVKSDSGVKDSSDVSSSEDTKPLADKASPKDSDAVGSKEPASTSEKTSDIPTEVPFHKHPRFREVIKEKNRLAERLEQIEKAFGELQSRSGSGIGDDSRSRPADVKSAEIPAWFQDVFGQNVELWTKYQQFTAAERDNVIRQIYAEQEARAKHAEAEKERWVKWRDTSLRSIEDEHGVDFSTPAGQNLKNEFFAFIKRVKPTDDQGNIDLINGWQFFQEYAKKPEAEVTDKAKKHLAAMATSDTKPEAKQRGYTTSSDIRRKGFHELARL